MPTNDFLPFATSGSPNVIDQASYAAATSTGHGYVAGLADSRYLNKTWRQAAFIASCLAQYVCNTLGANVVDNGSVSAFLTQLAAVFGNLAGGAANEVPYQSAPGVTTFVAAPTTAGQVLSWTGSALAWLSGVVATLSVGHYTIQYSSAVLEQYIEVTDVVNGTFTFTYPVAFGTRSYIPSWSVLDTSGEGTADQVVASVASMSLSGCTLTVGVNGGSTTRTVTIGVTVKGI